MAELVELYSKGVKRKLKNYWAAWLPNTRISVGDIGTLNGYLFEKATSLRELNLKYHAEPDGDPSPLDLTSESGVALSFKAAGETSPSFAHVGSGDAGLKIDFGSEGAFILQSPETRDSEIGDRLNLQRQIVQAFERGDWQKDWLVVTRVLKAASATVLLSKSSNASLELSAKANLAGDVAALGSADAGITVKYQQGDTLTMIGARNVTPLFQLSRLKTGIFAQPKLITKSLRASDPSLVDLTPARVGQDRAVRESLVLDLLEDDELAPE